jgi:hypothetical protein
MKTLLEQIKPEIVKSIKTNKYKFTREVILAKLESCEFYSQLTIGEIQTIYEMSGIKGLRVSAWDLRYGDNILIEDYE